MVKRGAEAIPSDRAMPSIEISFCVVCGMPARWKYDRRGRPYLSCSHCTIRIFPHGHTSIAGLEMLHGMLKRSGVQRHRQAVQAQVQRRLQRVSVS